MSAPAPFSFPLALFPFTRLAVLHTPTPANLRIASLKLAHSQNVYFQVSIKKNYLKKRGCATFFQIKSYRFVSLRSLLLYAVRTKNFYTSF